MPSKANDPSGSSQVWLSSDRRLYTFSEMISMIVSWYMKNYEPTTKRFACALLWNSETETCHKHSREQAPKGSGQAYFSVISISVSTDGILCPCSMTLTSLIFLDGKVKVEKSFSHNRVILRTILRYWFYCIRQLETILSITFIQIDTLKYSWW